MTSCEWRSTVASIFDAAAPYYADAIAPIMAQLARDFVGRLAVHPGERVLDVGTGTGVAACEAARRGGMAVGVDSSRAMLGHTPRERSSLFVQADMHNLPFGDDAFDVALAQFALNSSDPAAALREWWRVLRPGGGLWILEWDEPDALSELVNDTFVEYCVVEPSADLAALRAQAAIPIPWDAIETVEELVSLVASSDFEAVDVIHTTCVVSLHDGEDLLRYKLAWPIRRAELRAMSSEVRDLCLSDLRENLVSFLNPDGSLDWHPKVILIHAGKVR